MKKLLLTAVLCALSFPAYADDTTAKLDQISSRIEQDQESAARIKTLLETIDAPAPIYSRAGAFHTMAFKDIDDKVKKRLINDRIRFQTMIDDFKYEWLKLNGLTVDQGSKINEEFRAKKLDAEEAQRSENLRRSVASLKFILRIPDDTNNVSASSYFAKTDKDINTLKLSYEQMKQVFDFNDFVIEAYSDAQISPPEQERYYELVENLIAFKHANFPE